MDFVMVHSNIDERGGAERILLKIAEGMDAKTIYTFNYEPQNTFEEFKEFNVVEIGNKKGSTAPLSPLRAYNFYRYRIPENYDVINAQWPPSHWARNKNPRMVWFCYSPARSVYDLYEYRMKEYGVPLRIMHPFYSLIYRKIDKQVVNKIEHVFAISNHVKLRLLKYLGKTSETLHPGVDYEKFYLGDYKKYFFYPSRITPTKRFELALEAFDKFKKMGFKNWEFIIAGDVKPSDMWYYNKLKSMGATIKSNLSQKELLELYANCYAVLFTPIREDYGMVPLEAQSAYKPVIAINEGGPRETVANYRTGFLVNSVEEITQKMVYLAEHPDVTEQMGKSGRRRVENKFTWDLFLRRFKVACNKVAGM